MSSEIKFRALTSEDWKEGIEGYLTYNKCLSLSDNENDSTYTSETLDSLIFNCSWYRIALDADIPENSTIAISFVTSETEEVENSPFSGKIVFTKAKDSPIYITPGRYIRLSIDFHRESKEAPVLRQLKIYHTYISQSLDSGVPGCSWNRIVLDAEIPPDNSAITISAVTSETEEAKTFLNPAKSITFTKAKDALLQVPPGRYIRLRIDFHREGEETPSLRQVKVYYERLSYLRCLPAIYQENSKSKEFLERFLSIFESSLYDSEETISNLPIFFDPMAAPKDFYRWLANWVSLDLYDQLDENAMREYILQAVKFYKQKGTVSGISSLVSFLIGGKKCCIKEYRNNIFRSWGMEHEKVIYSYEQMNRCIEYEANSEYTCTKFYHETSRTLDTNDQALLESLGKNKYYDKVHYVFDTSDDGTYSPNIIGIFIFLKENEGFVINEKKYVRQLHKIIDSFLPVFVRAKIHIVVMPYIERYDINNIIEKFNDSVHALMNEKLTPAFGSYVDETNWICIYSFDDKHSDVRVTNNVRYRTHHSGIGQESSI